MKVITKTIVSGVSLNKEEVSTLNKAYKILDEISDILEEYCDTDLEKCSSAICFIMDILDNNLTDLHINKLD